MSDVKKLTPIQEEALNYISSNNIDEIVYVKKHLEYFNLTIDEKNFYDTYKWTFLDAKIVLNKYKTREFEWCLDGKTVKALFLKNIFIVSKTANGKYGDYPIGYKIHREIFDTYFSKINLDTKRTNLVP